MGDLNKDVEEHLRQVKIKINEKLDQTQSCIAKDMNQMFKKTKQFLNDYIDGFQDFKPNNYENKASIQHLRTKAFEIITENESYTNNLQQSTVENSIKNEHSFIEFLNTDDISCENVSLPPIKSTEGEFKDKTEVSGSYKIKRENNNISITDYLAAIKKNKTLQNESELIQTRLNNLINENSIGSKNKTGIFRKDKFPTNILAAEKFDEATDIEITEVRSGVKKVEHYKCQVCEFSTNAPNVLQNHILEVHEKLKRFTCTECDYASRKKYHLQEHIRRIHIKLPKIKDQQCDQCDYATSEKRYLVIHGKQHHTNERDFKCDKCLYATSNKAHLKAHIKSVHDMIKDKQCPKCEKAFSKTWHLNEHVNRVHETL